MTCRIRGFFCVAVWLGMSPFIGIAGPPAPALPQPIDEFTRSIAKATAIKFARRDVEKTAGHAKALSEKAEAAARNSTPAEKLASDAKTAQKSTEKLLAETQAAIEAADKAKKAGDKKFAEAIKALEEAKKATEEAVARLVTLGEKKKLALVAKRRAAEETAELTKAAKPLIAIRAAAEKAAAEAKKQDDDAQKRLALLETKAPQADPKSIRLVKTFKHDRPMMSCRFDPTGQYLFAGAQDNNLHRWDLVNDVRATFLGHQSWVRRFDLHDSKQLLVTGAYAGRVIWWNPLDTDPKPLRTIDAHKGFVRAVDISPDSRFVATAGNDNIVRIWSADDGHRIAELTGHTSHVYNLKFHPDGTQLVSGDLMGVLKQWDVSAWKHVRDLDAKILHKYDTTFRAHCGGIRGMDYSADGQYLLVSGIGEVTNAFAGTGVPMAITFDSWSGQRLRVHKPAGKANGTMWGIRMHPSGEFFVGAGGGGGSGHLWFWKPSEETPFFKFQVPGVCYDVAFHPDGLRLAVALYDKTVRIYDLGPKIEVAKVDKSTAKPAK